MYNSYLTLFDLSGILIAMLSYVRFFKQHITLLDDKLTDMSSCTVVILCGICCRYLSAVLFVTTIKVV